jgi:hypothetical protein
MIRSGMKQDEIIDQIRQEGFDEDYCRVVIANIENDAEDRRNFWKMLFGGLFITLGGLAINLIFYMVSLSFGTFLYYVFWGIVVSGIVMIIRAFILFRK